MHFNSVFHHMISFIFLCILVTQSSGASIATPNPASSIATAEPSNLCIAGTKDSFFDLRCSSLQHPDTLQQILLNLTERDYILELSHLQWETFPLHFFQNVSLHTLIVANSTFNAFENSTAEETPSLLHISLENITFQRSLRWEDLASLTKLEVLSIYNTTIDNSIDASFGDKLSKFMEVVTIAKSNVTDIKADSFRQLRNLHYLRVSHNKLVTFPRLILKAPEKLEYLRLDYNRINSLPSGVFDSFNNLKVLSLSNNSLSTLPEDVFSVLWKPYMQIELRDNPIKCDCRMQWMVLTSSQPRSLVGKCSHPKRLYGRNLKDLRKEDFNCNESE